MGTGNQIFASSDLNFKKVFAIEYRTGIFTFAMGKLLTKIQAKLNKDGTSYRTLAKDIGVSHSMLCQIKTGARVPNVNIAEKILRYYGITEI